MARVKNVGGGLGDEDLRRPPHLPTDAKGKAMKKLAMKKRKYPDTDTVRAAAVQPPQSVQRQGLLGLEYRLQIGFL